MSTQGDGRLRAWLQSVAALIWFFIARSIAHRGSAVLAGESLQPLAEAFFLAALLVIGISGLGFWMSGRAFSVQEQGLPAREGWQREAALGLAAGWSVAMVCTLFLALGGGIAFTLSLQLASWKWLLADTAFFALMALAEELAFRGYAFQRFLRASGSSLAVLLFAFIYALVQAQLPGSNLVSFLLSMVLSFCLSMAYLRTRALWVSWGLNFGWKAGRALLFGLAISGNSQHSPVIQGDPLGPFWLTGGGFGLDGSWMALLVLLLALPLLHKATRELDYRYNAPVFVPAGIAVDLDAAARTTHEQAMGTPAEQPLVQIQPASVSVASVVEAESAAVDSTQSEK